VALRAALESAVQLGRGDEVSMQAEMAIPPRSSDNGENVEIRYRWADALRRDALSRCCTFKERSCSALKLPSSTAACRNQRDTPYDFLTGPTFNASGNIAYADKGRFVQRTRLRWTARIEALAAVWHQAGVLQYFFDEPNHRAQSPTPN
jgi:hypothetical protein